MQIINLVKFAASFGHAKANKMPRYRYRREDRAMPLYILIRIEFYNGITRFLCHSMAFL